MPSPHAKLVAPAILRKLDPSLPGIDESLVELESISLPRFQVGFPPQRLTMTLLGDFWAGREHALPSGVLVRLLGAFDINEQAARVALGRLAARGALVIERRGRTTWYRQSPTLLALLPQGRAMTASFGAPRTGWDGTWTILTWSMANGLPAPSQRLRTHLRELGFAPLAPGVWVSPDPPAEELSGTLDSGDVRFTVFRGSEVSFPNGVAPGSAWNLDEIRPTYDEFLTTFRPLLKRASKRTFGAREALVTRIRAVYRWFVIATLDPDLPAELLPPDWPRAEAHEVFVSLVDTITPRADAYVRAVVAEWSPEAAALVTMPPPYGAAVR